MQKPEEKEFRIQALVDSAGAFAAGAERLDDTALRLQKLMSTSDEKLQVDKDRIESIYSAARVKRALVRFSFRR